MGTRGYLIITINNKSYYIYNHWDSDKLSMNTMKILKFLLLRFTNDELVSLFSKIEFTKSEYRDPFTGSDENDFGYVVDDEDRKWNEGHISLFKILRDKKAEYMEIVDGPVEPYVDIMIEYSVVLNIDTCSISFSSSTLTFDALR